MQSPVGNGASLFRVSLPDWEREEVGVGLRERDADWESDPVREAVEQLGLGLVVGLGLPELEPLRLREGVGVGLTLRVTEVRRESGAWGQ